MHFCTHGEPPPVQRCLSNLLTRCSVPNLLWLRLQSVRHTKHKAHQNQQGLGPDEEISQTIYRAFGVYTASRTQEWLTVITIGVPVG